MSGARPTLPRPSEADWQDQVLEIANLYRWCYYHTFDSRRSNAGFPDLVLWRPGRLLFRELKADTGAVTPAQSRCLDQLRQAGADVGVWRPKDINRVLAELQPAKEPPRRIEQVITGGRL